MIMELGLRLHSIFSAQICYFFPLDEASEKYCRLSRASVLEPDGLAVRSQTSYHTFGPVVPTYIKWRYLH